MLITSVTVGPVQTNCYIVACEDTRKAIVVDPGDEPQRILESIHKNKLDVIAIINTHGHFDHAGANAALHEAINAPIWIHEKDAFLLPILSEMGVLFGLDIPNSPPADAYLMGGQEITVGNLTLEVLDVPGHTQGGIALYAPDVLFSGDSLFAGSIGRTDLPGGNIKTLIGNIQNQLMELPDETVVYPGHGPATTIGEERKQTLFYKWVKDSDTS